MPLNTDTGGEGGSHNPLLRAEAEVLAETNLQFSIHEKNKSLRIAGFSDAIGTTKRQIAVFSSNFETYPTSNDITHIVSSSASDTEQIRVEGHTIDADGNLTFSVQFPTLTGQTPVALATPLARSNIMRNLGSNDLVGAVRTYEGGTVTAGVPDDLTTVHSMIPAGFNHSKKAASTISQYDAFFVTRVSGSVARSTGTLELSLFLQERRKGGVFYDVWEWGLNTAGQSGNQFDLDPVIEIHPNSDFRVLAQSLSGTGIRVTATVAGYLALRKDQW